MTITRTIRTSLAPLLVLTLLLAAGCAQLQPTTPPDMSLSAESKAMLAETQFVKLQNLPGHTKAVLATLLQTMRREKPTLKEVRYDPEGSHQVGDPYSDFAGYQVLLLEIDMNMARPVGKNSDNVLIKGAFTFQNDVGQTRTEMFFADYLVTPGKPIVIQSSVTAPVYCDMPTVVGYFVPLEALAQAAPTLNSFRDFYLFAMANGIDMLATPEDQQAKARYDQLSFFEKVTAQDLLPKPMEGEFAFLAFCMDRLSPLASFEIRATNTEKSAVSLEAKPEYVFYPDGFGLAVLQGKGKLFDSRTPFFVHAYYCSNDPGAQPDEVALFSSEKLYGPVTVVSVPPGSEWVVAKLDEAGSRKAVAAAPSRLLNPRDKGDAKLIQQALAEEGYYAGQVDGLFGKKSLAALQAFRKAAMGQNSAQWDMQTQKLLFR